MDSTTCPPPTPGEHGLDLGRTPAGVLSVMLQSLTGLDAQAHNPGRMRIATMRHQLIAIPGRLTSHAHITPGLGGAGLTTVLGAVTEKCQCSAFSTPPSRGVPGWEGPDNGNED